MAAAYRAIITASAVAKVTPSIPICLQALAKKCLRAFFSFGTVPNPSSSAIFFCHFCGVTVFTWCPWPSSSPCQKPKFSPNRKAELTPSPGMEWTCSTIVFATPLRFTKLLSTGKLSSARQVSIFTSRSFTTYSTHAEPLLQPGSTPRYEVG